MVGPTFKHIGFVRATKRVGHTRVSRSRELYARSISPFYAVMVEWRGSQRLGDLVFSKLNRGRSSPHVKRPPIVRAMLLLVACVSLSACSAGDFPVEPGSPAPSPSGPESSSSSAPGPGTASPSSPGPGGPSAPQTDPTESTPTSPETVTAGDPDDVPPDDTDYSKDVGNTPQQYEYEPEPEPPESVVATLCNLNQVFFKGLRETESGKAVADSALRTSTVALDDLTDYWETLRAQYPDAAADIDTGISVHEQWKTALLDQENGDQREAQKAMATAEELIEKLPEVDAVGCHR